MMFTATHFGNINPATVEHSLWQDLSANCSSICTHRLLWPNCTKQFKAFEKFKSI